MREDAFEKVVRIILVCMLVAAMAQTVQLRQLGRDVKQQAEVARQIVDERAQILCL